MGRRKTIENQLFLWYYFWYILLFVFILNTFIWPHSPSYNFVLVVALEKNGFIKGGDGIPEAQA